MSRLTTIGMGIAAVLIAKSAFTPSPSMGLATQKLAVREETERVVLAWSGPIAEPMRDDIAAVLARFRDDPRRLVLTLNSPGGSLGQGREVMTVIREAARLRRIDMRVENGAVCASMCVPIYLLGTERTADPQGHFMFHEASLAASTEPKHGVRTALAVTPGTRKTIETFITDHFYEDYLNGSRVNARWVRDMRGKIVGRDVWLSAQQLMDERSGIVDALRPTKAP